MKAKNLAVALTIGFFGVAFARNGTLNKLANSATSFARTGVGGFSKVSRKI